MYAARAADLADVIEKMGATDFLLEDVIRVLATSPTEDMDERFYRRIELFKTQIPQGSASRMIELTEGGEALFRHLGPTLGLRIPARIDQSFRRKVNHRFRRRVISDSGGKRITFSGRGGTVRGTLGQGRSEAGQPARRRDPRPVVRRPRHDSRVRQEHAWMRDGDGPHQPALDHGLRGHHPRRAHVERSGRGHRQRVPELRRVSCRQHR